MNIVNKKGGSILNLKEGLLELIDPSMWWSLLTLRNMGCFLE